MTSVSIRRGDGFGYQLAARMITEVLCEIDGQTYHHNKITIADRKHIKDQVCLDFLYKQITGKDNVTLQQADTYYTNWIGYLKNQHQNKRRISPTFDKKMFDRYSSFFLDNNSKYNCFDDKQKHNIVMHIRRGDVIEQDYGRCLDDDIYTSILDELINTRELDRDDCSIYIETDSPEMVKSLAKKISAKINVSSEYCDHVISHHREYVESEIDVDEWRVVISMLQSIYNMASCDFFIPSRSSFSVIGGLLGNSKIVTNRIKQNRTKPVDILYPADRTYLQLPEEVDKICFQMYWLHYLPIINTDDIKHITNK